MSEYIIMHSLYRLCYNLLIGAKISEIQRIGQTSGTKMIELKYSLIIEATQDPTFFAFYSPELEGFTGVGHSIEDCIFKAKCGMEEHIALLKERGLPISKACPNPKIIIQNEERLTAVT